MIKWKFVVHPVNKNPTGRKYIKIRSVFFVRKADNCHVALWIPFPGYTYTNLKPQITDINRFFFPFFLLEIFSIAIAIQIFSASTKKKIIQFIYR